MNRYILKITGKRIDTFLSFLIKMKIPLKKIKESRDTLIIEVLEEDYDKLKRIKTTYQIEILKRKGLIYFTHILRTRKLFLSALIMGFLLLTILSNMIFNIKIIDNNDEIINIIMNDLSELGINKYHFKVNYQTKEEIEKKILQKEKDKLEWLEIEEIGTTYQVKLIKRIKNNIKKEQEERSIIAKKNGLITKIIADKGEVVTKKNAYVNKGDILISGLIKNKDNIVSKVRSEGSVYAEVWYKVTLNLPRKYTDKKKTGKKIKTFNFHFLNNNFYFPFNWYKKSQNNNHKIWKDQLLPLSFNFTTKEEIELINIDYTENYKKNILPLAISKLKMKLGSNIKIISEKILKKEVNTAKIKVDIFFKVEEDITDYISLKEIDIEKENAKQAQEE